MSYISPYVKNEINEVWVYEKGEIRMVYKKQ